MTDSGFIICLNGCPLGVWFENISAAEEYVEWYAVAKGAIPYILNQEEGYA